MVFIIERKFLGKGTPTLSIKKYLSDKEKEFSC